MLRVLSIRDFVIVDALELDFSAGFTVFSGETGAGKSILIDALALLLGARADALVVRDGAKRAEVSAEFDTAGNIAQWLGEQALDDGERVLLRRVIDDSGRSRAFINGTPVTLAQLRELGEMLVDIHGQHAHQMLLKRQAQRELVDAQAGLAATVRELGARMQRWRELMQRRQHASANEAARAAEEERLRWQLDELERLDPQAGEWDAIQAEHERLSHAASLIEAAQGGIDLLADADEAMLARLAPLVQRMRQLLAHDGRLEAVLDILEPAEIQLKEAAHALRQYLDHLELDPERLRQLETRLEAFHAAARKLRVAPDSLPAERERLAAALSALQAGGDDAALAEAEAAAKADYFALADEISATRTRYAKELSQAITDAMQALAMEGGHCDIVVSPQEPSMSGIDAVEFLVAGHAGTEARPLAKIASGGELARISLAIAVIASAAGTTPTLIFDEVDAGIGGAVAEVVGRLLKRLSQTRQVLCVTHLAQVAAQADSHLEVSKATTDGRTASAVRKLNASARVEEIARMLGGIEITATTRKHARELLTQA